MLNESKAILSPVAAFKSIRRPLRRKKSRFEPLAPVPAATGGFKSFHPAAKFIVLHKSGIPGFYKIWLPVPRPATTGPAHKTFL